MLLAMEHIATRPLHGPTSGIHLLHVCTRKQSQTRKPLQHQVRDPGLAQCHVAYALCATDPRGPGRSQMSAQYVLHHQNIKQKLAASFARGYRHAQAEHG
jgi:hypothetical protein